MADSYNTGQVAALAKLGGFSGHDEITTMTAIALAESGGRMVKGGPNHNGTYDWGIWQINDIHKPSEAIKTNPVANAKAAHAIYVQAGNSYKPWSTYNSGKYKDFWTEAELAYYEQEQHPEIGAALAKGGGATGSNFGSIAPGSPADQIKNAAADVPGSITGGINALTKSFFGVTANIGVLIVALVFLILGVVVLLRRPIVSGVSSATPIGRAAKLAKVAG
jgi:Lysozyme like domain